MIVILNFTIYNCTSLNFLMCWLAGESTNPTRHLQGALSILLFMHRSLALRMFNVAEIEIGLIEIGFGEHTFCHVGITPFSCWRNEHTSVQNNTQSQSEVKMWRWKVFIRPDLRPLCFPPMHHHYLPWCYVPSSSSLMPLHIWVSVSETCPFWLGTPSTPPPQITRRNMKEEGGSKTMQETCCTVSCLPTSLGTKKPAWQARNLQAIEIHSSYICITSFKDIIILKYQSVNFT